MKNLILIAGCFLFLSPCLAGKALPEASLNVPCISGRVFFDLNHNNLVDPSTDYPMSGITVYLKDLNDQVLQTAITNDDGLYFFCDVPLNDDFILEEVVPSPNYPVSPASGSITITNYPYINGDPNFLNFGPTATIRVTKMNDVNGNGVIDEDDEHVPGITFNLFDQNNTLFLTATSDEDGLVSLFPIPSGTYTLKEVIPPGYEAVLPENGEVTLTITGTSGQLIQFLNREKQPCCNAFEPIAGTTYWVSAWVKENRPLPVKTYASSYLELEFITTGTAITPIQVHTTGEIIDGWQRIVGSFVMPSGVSDLKINLVNNNFAIDAFFDDIRIHPFNASMKSYVYDPETNFLSAELDDNNYATFYEYDNEGQLIRIKKETARGIMTIQETRSNNPKKP